MEYVFLRFPLFKDKAVTLSYDDGVTADKRFVEILNKYNIKCTFNVSTGLAPNEGRIHLDEMVDLYKGHEIAAHGKYHHSLAELSTQEAVCDVIDCKRELEYLTGERIIGMAYASGSYDDTVVNILDMCGIKYCRTTKATYNFFIPNDWLRLHPTCHHNYDKLFDLVEEFVTCTQPIYYWARHAKLFYLWGHSYEFDNDNNWDRIEEFCKRVGNRDDIWYATNKEVYDYVEAFKQLEFFANGKKVYNPTSKTIYFDYFEGKYQIKPGETISLVKE